LNLAILIGHFPPTAFGGAELQAESWARHLAARHRVTVVTRCDAKMPAGRETRDGFDIVRLPVSRVPGWRTFADVFAIERAIAKLAPRPDVLLCFQTFVSGVAGTRAGRKLGIPAVVWVRGEAEYGLGDSVFMRWLSPRVWSAAAATLVQTQANREALLGELRRHAPARFSRVEKRLHVIGNGLDLPEPTSLPASAGPGVVLTVGRLIQDKGMDTVLEACDGNGRDVLIVGEGPEREALEWQAMRRGIHARFTGHVGRAELARLYDEASVVVLAARRGEGLPNVLLEGMARARPVVATPCAGTRGLVEDGVNGLLVPPDDVAALAAALARLDREPGLAARLAAAGRATVEPFAWENLVPKLEALLEQVARR
jgi:glycosyltransferase involved in cell wall biosynthesis